MLNYKIKIGPTEWVGVLSCRILITWPSYGVHPFHALKARHGICQSFCIFRRSSTSRNDHGQWAGWSFGWSVCFSGVILNCQVKKIVMFEMSQDNAMAKTKTMTATETMTKTCNIWDTDYNSDRNSSLWIAP